MSNAFKLLAQIVTDAFASTDDGDTQEGAFVKAVVNERKSNRPLSDQEKDIRIRAVELDMRLAIKVAANIEKMKNCQLRPLIEAPEVGTKVWSVSRGFADPEEYEFTGTDAQLVDLVGGCLFSTRKEAVMAINYMTFTLKKFAVEHYLATKQAKDE